MDLGLDNLPALGGANITAVEAESRARDHAANTGGTYRHGVSDAASLSTLGSTIDPGAGFAVSTDAIATNEAGLAWDKGRIDNTYLRLRKIAGGASTSIDVDYAWLNVSYDVVGGSFGFTLGFLLPLIGVGLKLSEMPAVASALSRMRYRARLTPDELVRLYGALRDDPRRVYA